MGKRLVHTSRLFRIFLSCRLADDTALAGIIRPDFPDIPDAMMDLRKEVISFKLTLFSKRKFF